MTLSKILEGVKVLKMFQTLYGKLLMTQEIHINHVQYDSRKIVPDDVFVAIRGTESDGHKFIEKAVSSGAKVVVVENDSTLPDSYFMHSGVVKIVVPNSRAALAQMSANYFEHPSNKLKIIGITGTNGKTTTTHLIKSILEISGVKTGLIGTIEYKIGNEVVPASHTTPESLELNELLARMVQSGCTSAVMEVSSHALHQYRVAGINFIAAVFTNLTQDHLDYHGTMDEYFKAKKILFKGLQSNAFAIVNLDDKWGKRIPNVTLANVKSYGFDVSADFFAKNISISMKGVKFTIVYNGEETDVESRLIGRFNVSNILAAFSTGIALGIPKEIVRNAISKAEIVRGRFEQITSPNGWTAVIDYAHTPDALEKALKAIHDVFDSSSRGRIITVFGCGGNRDRTKRPKMTNIATTLSDITIVSSDNPRHEDPEAIIDEIMTGVKTGAKVYREADRKQAIFMALDIAKIDDVILIAGKGHEDYQVVGDRKIYFSDRKTVEEFLQAHV